MKKNLIGFLFGILFIGVMGAAYQFAIYNGFLQSDMNANLNWITNFNSGMFGSGLSYDGRILTATNGSPSGPQIWTNDATGTYMTTNGETLRFPSVGYDIASSVGYIFRSVEVPSSQTPILKFESSYQNNTNGVDNSINSVFREGWNLAPNSGAIVPGIGGLGRQLEFHYNQSGQLVMEAHEIFIPTNNVEERYWTSQLTLTNGNVAMGFSLDSIQFNPHTNASLPAMQWTMHWIDSTHPLMQMSMNNGGFLDWSYPNGQGVMIQAEDSTSATRQILNWDPSNKRLSLVNNGDIQAMQIGADLWFPYNTGIGLPNTPTWQPKWLITANGGITAGGITDPGAGNVSATNGFFGNGASVTNLTYQYITNNSGTTTLNWGLAYRTNLAANVTIALQSVTDSAHAPFYQTTVYWVTNNSGANHSVTSPSGVIGPVGSGTPSVLWATNNTVTRFLYEHYGPNDITVSKTDFGN